METTLFRTKEEFKQMRQAWKASANDNETRTLIRPFHYILYSMLRGKSARNGFTPCTCPRKLANGQHPDRGFDTAKGFLTRGITRIDILLAPFGGTVSEDMLKQVIVRLKEGTA